MAEDLGVAGNYMMVKAVDNEQMPYFYNLADIVLSVTSTDGFPVTVLEASACECPMIITKLDYTSEWFVNGENGVLIPARNSPALSDAILKLYENKPLMEKIRKTNRRLVEEKADYEKCMLDLEKLYYDLVSKYKN
ncbi:MAG: glycosyltransferase [Nitrospiraceae bacterium]|nr:MAG: glycosyltransferase [Nitrospiraceae bacterium]